MQHAHPMKTHRHPKPRKSARTKYILGIVSPILTVLIVAGFFLGIMMSAEAHGVKSAQSFVQNASVGNQFEISSSQLALQKSQNDDVRQFAQHMIDDHTRVGDRLKETLASMDNAPAPASGLDAKHQHMLNKLQSASGAGFDKLYVHDQVKAHKEAVGLFQDYGSHGDNDALKGFASDMLPTLQEHEDKIRQIDKTI